MTAVYLVIVTDITNWYPNVTHRVIKTHTAIVYDFYPTSSSLGEGIQNTQRGG